MEIIHLRQTLPQVFADRDAITSDVWHQDLVLRKGEHYLIEAASGTGKSSLCSYIYGYRRDYQGIISFDERNIRSLSIHEWVELRKHSLSMLFQELRIFLSLGLSALAGYEVSNKSEKLLPDGSTLLDKDCFIYGGALTLELEAYLTDRVALLLNARERALFGSDIGKFHSQVSLGLKFIIN